jgi:uncharacterized protein YoxC
METQMKEEKASFAVERAALEARIEDEVRLRKLKKKQMNERYDTIRTEMTELWMGAKRDARREKKELTEKYERVLNAMTNEMESLEAEVQSVGESSQKLAELLTKAKQEKARAEMETGMVEDRYIKMVAQRNREINDLKENIRGLSSSVRAREARISNFESSYKEVASLAARVTSNKVKQSRFARWFRRRNSEQ